MHSEHGRANKQELLPSEDAGANKLLDAFLLEPVSLLFMKIVHKIEDGISSQQFMRHLAAHKKSILMGTDGRDESRPNFNPKQYYISPVPHSVSHL